MALRKALKISAIAIGLLIVLGVAVSLVLTVIGLIWAVVTAVATLLVVGGLTYAAVKGYRWLGSGDSDDEPTADTVTTDPIDRHVERYVDGRLTEDELERRLDHVFDRPPTDDIDRELQRIRDRS